MRTVIGKIGAIQIRQICLVKYPDGTEGLYKNFEDVYRKAANNDSTLEMVYTAIDERTGTTVKGFQPYYKNLCQIFKLTLEHKNELEVM